MKLSTVLFRGARLGAVCLGFLLLWGPDISLRRRRSDAPVALVLDGSASMATADAGKKSRAAAAADGMERLRSLFKNKSAPVFYRLGDRLKRDEDWNSPATASSSDFSLLADIPKAVPGLKAVFFISDGRRGGGADPLPRLSPLGVPFYTVGVGNPLLAPDLSVEDLRAPPFAFKNTDAQILVRLRLRDMPPGRAVLRVVSRGETLGHREISWNGEEVLEATVSFRPSRTGLESFELRAAPAGTAAWKSRAKNFVVDVSRDRRRILYISGRPGPDYAFLRQQLKSDPTVELVSFVILRDMEDVFTVSDRELSLIPFPSQAQLLDGLSNFDAVIFEDFSFNRFGIGAAGMEALRRFVEGGGGFLLLGQGDAFGPASPYRGSALEPILPFRFDAPPVAGPSLFRALPLAAGRALTSFDDGEDPWPRLPLLDGPGIFPGALRAGAVPLFGAEGAGASLPWAAFFSAGRGRTMAMDSLTTWRWALGEAGQGRGPEAYSHFWTRTLNWLTGGEEFRRVRLETPGERLAAGDDVLIRAYVRDEARKPLSDAEVRLEIRGRDGARAESRMSPSGDGAFTATIAAPAAGKLFLKARAFRAGRPVGEAEALLRIGTDWDESADVSTDFDALRALSRATGGRFTTLADFDRGWAGRVLDEVSRETERRISPGSSAWLAALLMAMLLLEWSARRGKGLP